MNETGSGTTCPACSEENAAGRVKCFRCHAPLDGTLPAWKEDLRRHQEDLTRGREIHQGWAKATRKRHMITGAITVFLLLTLFNLPGSLYPAALLLHALIGAVFGAPAGWVISRRRGGMFNGALTGVFVFGGIGLLFGAFSMIGGAKLPEVAGMAIGIGFSGILPGAIIGMSVEQDY